MAKSRDYTSLLYSFLPAPFRQIFGVVDTFGNVEGKQDFNDIMNSMKGKYTGANLTGAEMAANQFNAEEAQKQRDFEERMSSTTYQRTVQDMRQAGLNPALLLTGASGVSTPSGSTASSVSPGVGSLSDLLSLALLPLQMKQIAAQTENIRANTGLTNQKRLTEEQITKLQSIAAEWQPALNAETLANLSASVDKQQAEILDLTRSADLKVAQKDLVVSQKEAQAITNYYLPAKSLAEINKLDADARSSAASAWMTEIQAKFAKDNGFLMSSNDALLLGTYIASLFNVGKDDVENVISKASDYIKKEFKYDFHPWRRVSPEDAIAWYLEHQN